MSKILIVGLGNPEKEREWNRHNFGFLAIDYLINHVRDAEESEICVPSIAKSKIFETDKAMFCKPLVGLNSSGTVIKYLLDHYEFKDVIVIHDDCGIDLGCLRIKRGGKPGGHNGLKSIDNLIGEDYIRFRLGIGRPDNKEEMLTYVLSDLPSIPYQVMENTLKGISMLLDGSPLDQVQNTCVINKKGK